MLCLVVTIPEPHSHLTTHPSITIWRNIVLNNCLNVLGICLKMFARFGKYHLMEPLSYITGWIRGVSSNAYKISEATMGHFTTPHTKGMHKKYAHTRNMQWYNYLGKLYCMVYESRNMASSGFTVSAWPCSQLVPGPPYQRNNFRTVR